MRKVAILLVGATCAWVYAEEQNVKPMMRTERHLFYTYKLGVNMPNGYEIAEADAAKWCSSKGKGVIELTQPQCTTFVEDGKQDTVMCGVTFRCQ